MLEVRLLGQFQVLLDEMEIEISSQAARALMAYLVINKSKKHLIETLVGLFWADSSPDIGRKYLRNAITKLQGVLGSDPMTGTDYILADRTDVWIESKTEINTDVEMILKPLAGSPTIQDLSEELSNYGGNFLLDFSDDWVLLEREKLKSAFNRKIELLLDLLVIEKRWNEVIEWAERWIAIEKAPEAAFRAIMFAHASQGQGSLVNEDYWRCEKALLKESGIPPSELTSRTYRQLSLHNKFEEHNWERPATGEPGKPLSIPGSIPLRSDMKEKFSTDGTRIPLNTLVNGRYRLDRELGSGFMGVVYQAYDTRLGRPVAIKILRREHLGIDGYFRLVQEAQTIAKINHPNIITIYDAGEFEGIPYMVIELLGGETLTAHVPKPIDEVFRILLQICDALKQVHSYGIVHRDLKPENVMLQSDGNIKLMDFGLAHYDTSRMTREGEILGTIQYLSPEQALGKPVDARTDIYALGIMTYELVTGVLPFRGENVVTIITQQLYSNPVLPSEINPQIPRSLDPFILKLLAKAPEERPASISEVVDELILIHKASEEFGKPDQAVEESASQAVPSLPQKQLTVRQIAKSGIHLLLQNWRDQGVETIDVASLALIHSSPPDTTFEQEDLLLLVRSVLQRQLELDPWLLRAGSKENAVYVLEQLLSEYPRPEIRLKIVRGLNGLQIKPAAELLVRIATSDDAPNISTEAALAAAHLGMRDQLIDSLLGKISKDGDLATMGAFVAVMDEYGLPKEASGYPKTTVSIYLLQRRLKLKSRLIWRQGIRSAAGGGLFLALNGMAAPFLLALAEPAQFKETLEFLTVPAWMIISALGLLILGLFQGLASGFFVGFADAVWGLRSRNIARVILGALSGLAMTLYLILFTLIGAISPLTDTSIYYPVYIIHGLLMGIVISFVIPPLGAHSRLRSQIRTGLLCALAAILLTLPFVYLVYGAESPKFLLSRILLSVMLVIGIAVSQATRDHARSMS